MGSNNNNTGIMKINLTAIFDHPSAVYHKTRYARVDNVGSPIWIPGPNVNTSPATISPVGGVDNGQYRIGLTPVYADQRKCSESIYDTPACFPISTFNAIVEGNIITVTYVAPGDVPKVRLSINYPNGGSFSQLYTNGSNNSTIQVPLPTGLSGDISVYMQSVCDEESGFYSPISQPVIITYNPPVVINSSLEVLCDSYIGPNPSNRGLRYHRLKFNFAQPLTQPLELNIAFTIMVPSGMYSPGLTFGYGIIPDGVYEKTLRGLDLPTSYSVTIPAGTSSFTTNTLEYATITSFPPYNTDIIPCRDNSSNFNYSSEKVFVRVANIDNAQLNITSISNTNGYPTNFVQVP